MEAALTDALNWLETGGGDVVSQSFYSRVKSKNKKSVRFDEKDQIGKVEQQHLM